MKAFLRRATEDEAYAPVADVATVYQRLSAIHAGHFSTATSSDGLVQVSSAIGSTSFAFALPHRLDRAQIIEVAETALEVIEGKATVAEIRALLVRRRTTRADFSSWVVT